MPEETARYILIKKAPLSENEDRLDVFRDRRGELHRILCFAQPHIKANKDQRKVLAIQIKVPGREQELFVEPAEGIPKNSGLGHPLAASKGDVSHPAANS